MIVNNLGTVLREWVFLYPSSIGVLLSRLALVIEEAYGATKPYLLTLSEPVRGEGNVTYREKVISFEELWDRFKSKYL